MIRPLSVWTVYDSPRDFPPGVFVARRSDVSGDGTVTPTAEFLTAMSLEELRGALPPHLGRLPRMPEDEPHIVEVWL